MLKAIQDYEKARAELKRVTEENAAREARRRRVAYVKFLKAEFERLEKKRGMRRPG